MGLTFNSSLLSQTNSSSAAPCYVSDRIALQSDLLEGIYPQTDWERRGGKQKRRKGKKVNDNKRRTECEREKEREGDVKVLYVQKVVTHFIQYLTL